LHPDGSNDCLFLSIRNKRKEAHAIALSVGQSDAAWLGRGKFSPVWSPPLAAPCWLLS
jgi:hypothetical protein